MCSGRVWFDGLLRDIESAAHTINLQTYIFDIDGIAHTVLQALCDASRRGVVVRVIVDGVGSADALDHLQQMLHANGADLHIYHPLPWRWAATRLERGDWATRFFERFTKLNNRQHSKLCLIDKHIAWTGSYNVTGDHIGREDFALNWKDCGVRVTGERCQLLQEFFDAVWFQDIERLSVRYLLHPLTNFSPALRKTRLRTLITQINSARQRIWISSAYFAPIPRIVRALKKAGRRGVDVHIIVPAVSDVSFFPALASTYYADLLRAGIRIHEYESGILHTKHMLIDNQVVIGSSNMNHRSTLHDVELDIEIFSLEARQIIEQDMNDTVQLCREITLENLSRFYAWLLAFGQIPRLLRYWL